MLLWLTAPVLSITADYKPAGPLPPGVRRAIEGIHRARERITPSAEKLKAAILHVLVGDRAIATIAQEYGIEPTELKRLATVFLEAGRAAIHRDREPCAHDAGALHPAAFGGLGGNAPILGRGSHVSVGEQLGQVAAESTRIDQVSICSTEAVMMRCSTWAST